MVTSMKQAAMQFAARVPDQPIELVGHSGGGTLAVQMAAREPTSLQSARRRRRCANVWLACVLMPMTSKLEMAAVGEVVWQPLTQLASA
jgi:alpha-beta hydrolase superfamily lysophospholipase